MADQVETQGYHLREPVSTIDFSKKKLQRNEVANNEQSEEHKLVKEIPPSEQAADRKANPANFQYILYVERRLDGLTPR